MVRMTILGRLLLGGTLFMYLGYVWMYKLVITMATV